MEPAHLAADRRGAVSSAGPLAVREDEADSNQRQPDEDEGRERQDAEGPTDSEGDDCARDGQRASDEEPDQEPERRAEETGVPEGGEWATHRHLFGPETEKNGRMASCNEETSSGQAATVALLELLPPAGASQVSSSSFHSPVHWSASQPSYLSCDMTSTSNIIAEWPVPQYSAQYP